MPEPAVSIVVTTYNRPQYIARSIRSAVAQTYKDWELVVVDDSENDETEKVLKDFVRIDARIRYFHREKKGTIANASNYALDRARGKYVAILDDDDWWPDEKKLEKQTAFLDSHPDHVGCGGAFMVVDSDGREVGRFLKAQDDAAVRRGALTANPMANSTTMFRRIPEARYDESMRQFADWDFWLKLGTIGKLYNFPDCFLAYRMWSGESSFLHQRENAEAAVAIVRRYRTRYPGVFRAVIVNYGYLAYVHLPLFVRSALNPVLSRLKKNMFSG